ncbi:MAG TPA: NAD-dependent epimerase/dehydratase family protein [Opitutaceae bacterium]|nr:NAD-dependent epimerase/dehydratase family protein [Opitutaceae bacterium]
MVKKNQDGVAGRLWVFGAGYVGSALCRQALAAGWQVRALTRNAGTAALLQNDGIECVVADIASKDWHENVGRWPDAVVNCVSSGGGGLDGYRRSYLEGAASLAAWRAAARFTGTTVYTGSTSVYPQGAGQSLDETADTGSGTTELGEILLQTERTLMDGPGRTFILRLSGIYGPGRHHLLDALRAGETCLPGRGDFHLNLVHRDDIVKAIGCAIGAEPDITGGIFNITDDTPSLKQEVVSWLAEKLGKPTPTFSGEPASGRRRIVPDRIVLNRKAKAILGWSPAFPSFREGYAAILGA